MNAKELLQTIKDFLNANPEIEVTSNMVTKYDPMVLEKKESFIFFEKDQIGIYKKFKITIEESTPPTDSKNYE
jgi:hypothetical protein